MNWSHVWMLVRFQLRHSKYHFLLFLGIYVLIFLAILSNIPQQFEQAPFWTNYFSWDFRFIFFIILPIIFWRPKSFRLQLKGDVATTPFLGMLLQLPSPKRLITMYRFMYHLVVFVPIQLLSLTLLFIFSPSLQDLMTVGKYAVFILIWICFSILSYWAQALSDFGTDHSIISWVERTFIFIIGVPIFMIIFYGLYKNGPVHWTMFMATNYPSLSVIFAPLCTVAGTLLLKKQTELKMARFDYF